MISKEINALSIWFFKNLEKYEEIGHFVTARAGGHSVSPWNSLNLSFGVGDDDNSVLKNRLILSETLGIPLNSVTTVKQVHGSGVRIVSQSLRGKGASDYEGAIDGADALVANIPGICPMVLSADCVPILLYDPSKKVVGVVHAGWKGTLKGIAGKTINVFCQDFGSFPRDIIAGIGPSAGPCCYQVGPEVIARVVEAFGTKDGFIQNESEGRGYLDLWTANLKQLVRAGLAEENVEVGNVCTCHNSNVFFSHRCEGGKTGRFGAGIFLR
jgi:YfiH family protein